jgi:hypothetical protein
MEPDLTKMFVAEAALEEERLKRFKLESEVLSMWRQLEAGTLHVLWCNADHRGPIGNEGCSCPLGHTIKDLRQRLKEARESNG